MPLNCPLCNRVNPDEALFCCHDGATLGGARADGPIAVGVQPFPSPFVFATGSHCRTFDELVLACETHWDEARELLREGLLEGFLSGLGRADLSWAARRSAQTPDLDVGLDELLAQLPGSVRQPAQLKVQPAEINCGRVARSADHRFTIRLLNEGMGLIRGSVACSGSEWLVLGEDGGAPDKVFQFRCDQTITVRVVGSRLRAGFRPPEGRLVIESNGGATVVAVRVEPPAVVPFAQGVLAGADSPRRLAEMTRMAPRQAAVYFENGAVAAWYATNGWTYPVQGPPASGVAALQQFYEAVGLAAPPRVEMDRQPLRLEGAPGASLETAVVLQTSERRAVFAHAATTDEWLKTDRAVLGGRTARIPVRVPHVPDRPGEVLRGRLLVTANGNQRFAVEVMLAVSGDAVPRAAPVLTAPRSSSRDGAPAGRAPRGPEDKRDDSPAPRKRRGPGRLAWFLVVAFFLLALGAALVVVVLVVMTPSGAAAPAVGQAPAAPPANGASSSKPDNTPPKDVPAPPPIPPPPPPPADAADLARGLHSDDAGERMSALKKLAALGADARPAAAAVCEALKDADPAVKRQAAEVLGGLGPAGRDAAHHALLEALEDADVSAAAAAALAKLGPTTKADISDLLKLLKGKAEAARRYGLDCLREIGPDAADFAPFIRFVAAGDASPELRRRALVALLAVAPDADGSLAAYAHALSDDDAEVRRAAVEALVKVGPAHGALPGLIQAFASDDAATAKTAGDALKAAHWEKQAKEIGDALRDGNATLRLRVMELLKPLGPDAAPAVPAIIEVLKGEPGEARQKAIALVAAIGPPAHRASGALEDLLDDDKPAVRLDAATALAAIDGSDADEALSVLVHALEFDQLDDAQRDRAEAALGRIGAPAVKALLEALEDNDFRGGGQEPRKARSNADARLAVVQALGAMGTAADTQRVTALLSRLQRNDPSDEVKSAAKEALVRIRKSRNG